MVSPSVAAIVLAAGSSSRLGRAKQLLSYGGGTLLGHACRTALDSQCSATFVVIGSGAPLLREALASFAVEIVEHQEWERGMGGSIKAGVQAVWDRTALSAALIMACDQPLLTCEHLNALIARYRDSGQPIVASAYSGTIGIPALFERTIFPELLAIEDGTGAKGVLRRDMARVCAVDFPGGAVDVDTAADVEALTARMSVEFGSKFSK